jgi:hypothetical protein
MPHGDLTIVGTGDLNTKGEGKGKWHSITINYPCAFLDSGDINVPLKDGISDKMFGTIFATIMTDVRKSFNPTVIVVQW